MNQTTINSKYALALIDTVFGVVIAIPLLSVPKIILSFIHAPSNQVATQILLLMSSLLFCSFYWLEIHEFLNAQGRLNNFLKIGEDQGITPKQSRVFLGGIIMINSLAAILEFSTFESIEAFLVANIIFWVIDIFGSREVKSHYKPYSNDILQFKDTNKEVYEWYVKQIISPYYYIYAFTNILFFPSTLMLYLFRFHGDSKFGVCFGIILLFVTPIRHLFSVRQGLHLAKVSTVMPKCD
ncbi:MAG: hypothetical protein JM58_15405 [Peptococcaceae bacterium BICA1-8]|nr:MAG: hypothetical protein JM58_15405 [Peptococcaceae bacterium BICA1-8]